MIIIITCHGIFFNSTLKNHLVVDIQISLSLSIYIHGEREREILQRIYKTFNLNDILSNYELN